tara:strand:+ start:174 stop:1265 length:1092 start_codon:yes stop_codon:yes gene_type:complete
MVDPKEREKLKQDLIQRDDMDSLSNFFRSLVVRPTSQELTQPVVQEKQEISPPKDALVEELLAQNSEERDQYYQDLLTGLQAGAGEFSMQPGQPEVYTGPTKEELFKSLIAAEQSKVEPPTEKKIEEKETRLVNTPLLTNNYFDDSLDIDRFKIFYQGHNPAGKRKKNFKEAYDRATTDPKIQSNIEKNNVVSIIDSVIPAFPELKNHKIFNRDAFTKLAKYESAGGDLLVNKTTNDYGMFQLNEENIKRIFGTKKDFVNDTYTTDDKKKGIVPKGKKVGDTITSEEATKRADSAKKTFDGSFSQYFGNLAKSVTGYSANDLKKLYGENSKDFVRNFLKNNHKVNLGVAIAGTIMPNLDATKK